MSISTENFVKTIFRFNQNNGSDTKTGTLAKALGVTNAAVTDMARKLAAKDLIKYEKYRALQLTPRGEKMALNILRKHRLWETFLFQILELSLNEIHREAENLEHQTSDFLVEKISKFLGDPEFDPHGDPIPNSIGMLKTDKECIVLSQALVGKSYKISRIFSSDEEFFEFCTRNNLNIGTEVKIENRYKKNEMTEITVQDKKILLNKNFSDIIYIKEID